MPLFVPNWRACLTVGLLLGGLLAGCRAQPSLPTPLPPARVTRPASPAPRTPSPTPSPTATPTLSAAAQRQLGPTLRATLQAALAPTLTPAAVGFAGFPGVSGVEVALLPTQWPEPLWLAYTTGTRAYTPRQNHTVSVYAYGAAGWEQRAQVRLPNPDLVTPASVKVVYAAPATVWIRVASLSGAHTGCFDLLRYDGRRLHADLTHCASDPAAAVLTDLDDDGRTEVALNRSDDYVFCYACDVRIADFEVWRWQEETWQPLTLTMLPRDAALSARRLNDRAVRLAQGELWREAETTIRQAVRTYPEDEAIAWNARLIGLTAAARREQVRRGSYPLLSHLFYGDYAAALELMRPYKPAQLFARPSILVQGTVAERWESALKEVIWDFTTRTLTVDPNQAGAYFLRGWALYLVNPTDRTAYMLVQRAATLAPTDPLFTASAAYLR